ncbi:hypothetical protein [Dankookia rubra]|uniref:hypothetical protein n=1 Tax=Dankookia rubra TaxID=1442381 RepID=UPI001408B521|nr:hypothetical protein [Dankookia rubra]
MRDGRRGFQAGRSAAGLLVGLLAAGCSVPDEVNPVVIYDRISGKADANRPVPPGMDHPFPSLASIPPRPERPSPEFRQAVTEGLAQDRARSRDPLVLRSVTVPGAPGGANAGNPTMPAAPPGRAALAAAPTIPWTEAPPRPRVLQEGTAVPAAPSPALPEMPAEAPAAPPPDLLGPPPLPR